jgi:hypothetical protein
VVTDTGLVLTTTVPAGTRHSRFGDLRAELLALGVVRTSGESKRQEARTLALVARRRRERDEAR